MTGYSTLNTGHSALFTVIILPGNIAVGNHPLVSRFMREGFQIQHTLLRYTDIWDVSVGLKYICELSPVNQLSLLVFLFVLSA